MNGLVKVVIALVAVALIASSSLFVVSETERGVKLRFGRLIEADIQPGLHYKLPFADQVKIFDARVLTLDATAASFFTIEKKRLIVDSYAKWRIANVEAYYKATGGVESVANSRLANRVNNGLRNEFGSRTLREVVSGERDALMRSLTDELNATVLESLGIEVVDVRVKRIDLPDEVSSQVYRRMTAEREKEARELRSTGKEKAEVIRAAADRERTIELANAYRDAEQTRGDGDADAARIYSAAYQKDSEFYSFMRSLTAYKAAFANKGDVMLLEPDSDFFRYLNNQSGK